jgi:hypothetical protein
MGVVAQARLPNDQIARTGCLKAFSVPMPRAGSAAVAASASHFCLASSLGEQLINVGLHAAAFEHSHLEAAADGLHVSVPVAGVTVIVENTIPTVADATQIDSARQAIQSGFDQVLRPHGWGETGIPRRKFLRKCGAPRAAIC